MTPHAKEASRQHLSFTTPRELLRVGPECDDPDCLYKNPNAPIKHYTREWTIRDGFNYSPYGERDKGAWVASGKKLWDEEDEKEFQKELKKKKEEEERKKKEEEEKKKQQGGQ